MGATSPPYPTIPAGLALLTSMLNSLGHIIEEAANDRAAVRLMERRGHRPGPGRGRAVRCRRAGVADVRAAQASRGAGDPVIPEAHPERAKEALRQGAMAVLKYPVPAVELRAAVLQALTNPGRRRTRSMAAATGSRPARRPSPTLASVAPGGQLACPAPRG